MELPSHPQDLGKAASARGRTLLGRAARLLLPLIAGCGLFTTPPPATIAPPELHTGALRAIQARYYDHADPMQLLGNVVTTLQDLGFVITTSDPLLGFVSATKGLDEQELKMTVSVRLDTGERVVVRCSAADRHGAVSDATAYRGFFSALELALFINRQLGAGPASSTEPGARAPEKPTGGLLAPARRQVTSELPPADTSKFMILYPGAGGFSQRSERSLIEQSGHVEELSGQGGAATPTAEPAEQPTPEEEKSSLRSVPGEKTAATPATKSEEGSKSDKGAKADRFTVIKPEPEVVQTAPKVGDKPAVAEEVAPQVTTGTTDTKSTTQTGTTDTQSTTPTGTTDTQSTTPTGTTDTQSSTTTGTTDTQSSTATGTTSGAGSGGTTSATP